jgi:hypothetical protein
MRETRAQRKGKRRREIMNGHGKKSGKGAHERGTMQGKCGHCDLYASDAVDDALRDMGLDDAADFGLDDVGDK